MKVFCCYRVDKDDDGYDDLHFLELGGYKTKKLAYDALVSMAKKAWGHSCLITEDEENARVYVKDREYCVGVVELHDE